MKKPIIIYTFQSLQDPLVNGLILEYLKELYKETSDTPFHLITHEQKIYELNDAEKKLKTEELLAFNIYWYPVKYRNGSFLLLKKALNFLQTFFICLRIKYKYKPIAILGFLPIAGGYSYLLSRVFSLKLIVFCFEPHSKYMVDFKIWNQNSLSFKLLNYFEKLQLKYADYITLPTSYSMKEAEQLNPHGKKFLLPISVDTNLFKYSKEHRSKIRQQIGAGEKVVIIYTGKFGGVYYNTEDIIAFFQKLLRSSSNYFLYIISPQEAEIRKDIQKANLDSDSYYISGTVPYSELSEHLSAADIGVIAVPPLPSQKFRTPVKTGIYLSCGLPYIINKGVAEDDIMAQKENVGVVVDDLLTVNESTLHNGIQNLLCEDKTTLSRRCREIAIKYRSIRNSVDVLKTIFSDTNRV